MSFEAVLTNNQRWRWGDVGWQTALQAASSHRKHTIAVSWVVTCPRPWPEIYFGGVFSRPFCPFSSILFLPFFFSPILPSRSDPQIQLRDLGRTVSFPWGERHMQPPDTFLAKVRLVSRWPWVDLENLFISSHSHDGHLWQVSLKSVRWVRRYSVTRTPRRRTDGRTTRNISLSTPIASHGCQLTLLTFGD